MCTVIDYEHSLLLGSVAPVKKKSRAKKRAPPKALGAPLIVCDLHHELCRKGGTARSDNVVIEGYT